MQTTLKAPLPWFGGKSAVAGEIWRRFGDVPRYIEPFAGSGAVLLERPQQHTGGIEILNDTNGFIVNAYRAIQVDADAVWKHCDYPASELDIRARHADLQKRYGGLVEQLEADPRFYDAEAAGWWLWGASSTIAANWLRPVMSKSPPHLGSHNSVHANSGGAPLLLALQQRFRDTIITCGDWRRVVTFFALHAGRENPEMTGVLLDPPYLSHDRANRIYGDHDKSDSPAQESYEWAVETAASDPRVRIAYCAYAEHFPCPQGWSVYRWKTNGGMGNHGNSRGRENKEREVIYFSPSCLNETQQSLFE